MVGLSLRANRGKSGLIVFRHELWVVGVFTCEDEQQAETSCEIFDGVYWGIGPSLLHISEGDVQMSEGDGQMTDYTFW